jgi:glycosyltransferase involved in cell wall biosynthesis
VRRELGIEANAPLIGAVGALRKEKALEVLVRATGILLEDFPELRVIVAGSGPERAGLERLIDTLGLNDVIMLVGHRGDVPDVLAALDVAVLCSDREGSPLALKEYMAAGKPVVATRVGGVPELIDDGTHGLLVEPRDPHALAGAVARLLRDPELGARMGSQARRRQVAEFGIDAMVRRFEELYVELYDTATARRRRRDRSFRSLASTAR